MSLYVQVYPSPLATASRMQKIATSIHRACGFTRTHLVGVGTPDLGFETLEPGVTIARIQGSGHTGNLGRLLRAALWQPKVYLRYCRMPVTVIAAHQVSVLPLCWLIAKSTGAKLVYNPHELETEAVAMHGLKQRVARIVEARLIRSCDVVSAVNDAIADWYAERYRIARPVVATNVPQVHVSDVSLRQRLGVGEDEMLYIHTGYLTRGRNIPLILRAFADSPHHVVFLGDGEFRAEVDAAVAEHDNIHWLAPVAADLVAAHVHESDVGLCLIETDLCLSYRLSSPNKLHESLAVGVPALCSDMPYARGLLGPRLGERWVLADPETQLADALASISKADVAEFAATFDHEFDWDTEVKDLVEAYRSLI